MFSGYSFAEMLHVVITYFNIGIMCIKFTSLLAKIIVLYCVENFIKYARNVAQTTVSLAMQTVFFRIFKRKQKTLFPVPSKCFH